MERLNERLNEFKWPLGVLLVGGVLMVGGLFSSNLIQKDTFSEPENFPTKSLVSESELSMVKVDVAGAVKEPGVFSVSKEARIEDVVKLAGGFAERVNKEFVAKNLNLSQKVSDGLKVYVPFDGEKGTTSITGTTGTTGLVAGASVQGKVGINSAEEALLEGLPGVGAVTAKKIIDNRPYAKVEELLSKKVVSKAVYTKILDLVDLN